MVVRAWLRYFSQELKQRSDEARNALLTLIVNGLGRLWSNLDFYKFDG